MSVWTVRRAAGAGSREGSQAAPVAGAGWRLRRTIELRSDVLLAPVAGALILALLARPSHPLQTLMIGFASLALGVARSRRVARHAALLPVMRRIQPLIGPSLGIAGVALVELVTGVPHAGPLDLLAALGATVFVSGWQVALGFGAPGRRRAAFIGSEAGATRLEQALETGASSQYLLIGRVSCTEAASAEPAVGPPLLGSVPEMAGIVVEHDIDVLIMGPDAPRLAVFGVLADSCLDLPVRLAELSELFEEVFGHVPMAEINPTWFQCVADPRIRSSIGPLKRTVDVIGASLLLVLTAPILGLLALAIRRDGGPSLFRQVRIGESGRPFSVLKLRTMRVDADASAQWAAVHDPRVTRLGASLRRLHVDELPQLVNVLRGEMSLVGPRPEQPEFVDRLEHMLRFYQRRHLMRPGITGWAQVRCGYAGSDIGSAWKLCNDLYYVKHRSFGVDMLILGETLATLFLDREIALEGESAGYVLGEWT